MPEALSIALADEIAAYEYARQHGDVSEQASEALNLLSATTRHLLASDHPHNRFAALAILRAIENGTGE